MKLSELTKRVKEAECTGDSDQELKGLCYDSRKASSGDLFFACLLYTSPSPRDRG